MQRLMARKEKVIQDQAKGILDLFQRHRIHYLRGKGAIEKPGSATAQLGDGKIIEVPWDRLIVATGTQPCSFPAFPFDGQQILSSNDALCLQEVPASIMVLGGGVIGCDSPSFWLSLALRSRWWRPRIVSSLSPQSMKIVPR